MKPILYKGHTIVPSWAADGFTRVVRATVYVGPEKLGRFSSVAAAKRFITLRLKNDRSSAC